MQTNVLTIEIAKPVSEVFAATLDPKNTHKWISFIIEEKASEFPPKIGTIYSQRVREADGSESKSAIVVVGLIPNTFLAFHSVNSKYACYYTYESIPSGTRFTYSEDAGAGEKLTMSFTQHQMLALKKLLEEQR